MPLFALANAGVTVSGGAGGHGAASLVAGVVLGLVVGKPLGILAASYVLVRLGLSRLPTAVTWSGLAVVGAVGGIGFTMAIFVAGLAFEAPELLAPAKLGVLAASGLSAIVALGLGVLVLPKPAPAAVETPVDEAERSTEK
jgi:NhaA family Na+:H+ antiporter